MPRTLFSAALAVLFCLLAAAPAFAEGVSDAEMRSLDEQVQEIKSDVLGIAAELKQLEERLLFPSNTQVTVFVALDDDESFRLDSIRLGIDEELAAHHIYSFKELEALQSGGVQRLYMGNVGAGAHVLDVTVLGKLPNGSDFSREERFTFDKGVEPSLLGITLAPSGGSSDADAISLKDW